MAETAEILTEHSTRATESHQETGCPWLLLALISKENIWAAIRCDLERQEFTVDCDGSVASHEPGELQVTVIDMDALVKAVLKAITPSPVKRDDKLPGRGNRITTAIQMINPSQDPDYVVIS